MYETFPKLDSIPPELKMDFSRILNKPFFVKNVNWSTTDASKLVISSVDIPNDLFVNSLAKIPFQAGAMYRAKISLLMQVSGTSMHQGILLVGATPFGTLQTGPTVLTLAANQLLAGPHVFLNANEANSVSLEVPFYHPLKLDYCSFVGDNDTRPTGLTSYATVYFYVMNQLFAPTGATGTLTVSVYGVFEHLEVYVPHTSPTWVPVSVFESESISSTLTGGIDKLFSLGKGVMSDVLDSARQGIRKYTGLHSPNNPTLQSKGAVVLRQNNNAVDVPSQYEKLDPFFDYDRVLSEYMFDTERDEMSVLEILKKPQYIGSMTVASANPAGTLLFSRPITPIMEALSVSATDDQTSTAVVINVGSSLQRTLALMSRYWKGGLRVHIQSSMSNFHFCKLSVARNYVPNVAQFTGTPAFSDVSNLLTEVIEFSGGGQIQTIDLPYCSPFNQLPISVDWRQNSFSHGMFYIYLNQPLVVNGSVNPNINFNVYLSVAEDFQLFGYSTLPLGVYNQVATTVAAQDESGHEDEETFEPESQATVVVNTQKDLVFEHQEETDKDPLEHRPIVNIRDLARRNYLVYSTSLSASVLTSSGFFNTISLSFLLGSAFTEVIGANTLSNLSTLGIIRNMFFGYRGGAKIKMVITGTNAIKVHYLPPGVARPRSNGHWAATIPKASVAIGAGLVETDLRSQFAVMPFGGLSNPAFRTAQTVSIERPNYINSSKNYVTYSSSPISYVTATSVIHEFEIPYMTPYRFMGSVADIKGVPATVPISYNPASDMGNIVFSYLPDIPEAASVTSSGITIQFFVSVDDTARYGYQVYAPPIGIPAVPNTTTPLVNSYMAIPYMSTVSTFNATPEPSPLLDGCAACYKST